MTAAFDVPWMGLAADLVFSANLFWVEVRWAASTESLRFTGTAGIKISFRNAKNEVHYLF
jgi:hypothetical protein